MKQTSLLLDGPPRKDGEMVRGAEMSLDLRYRWRLDRHWGPGPRALWCCVNPSNADGQRDDPSCVRMMDFAKHWGCGGIVVVNLFALVSSSPRALFDATTDPIGKLCDRFIAEAVEEVVRGGGKLVAAWGNSVDFGEKTAPQIRGRDVAVLRLLMARSEVQCIGRNGNGTPRHPHARGKHRVPVETPLEVFALRSP